MRLQNQISRMTAKYDHWNSVVTITYILKQIFICVFIHRSRIYILIFWLIQQLIEHNDDDDDDDDEYDDERQ